MRARHVLFAALSFAGLVSAACTKSESADTGGATATATTATPSATPSASVTASTASATSASSAAPDASPVAADTTTGTAATGGATAQTQTAPGTTPPATAKDAGTAAAASSAENAACGTKPQPDCPLQAWMKSNANPPVMTSDTAGLAVVLDKIAAFAPPGYTNWASIAKDGAKAAKAGDLTAAKASCRTCHDQYKQKYKTEMRARKI